MFDGTVMLDRKPCNLTACMILRLIFPEASPLYCLSQLCFHAVIVGRSFICSDLGLPVYFLLPQTPVRFCRLCLKELEWPQFPSVGGQRGKRSVISVRY